MNSSVDTGEQPVLRSAQIVPIRREPKQEVPDVSAGVDDSRIEAGDYRDEASTRVVHVDTTLYESARLIAELRGESVDNVVARALRSYARGRRRPRD